MDWRRITRQGLIGALTLVFIVAVGMFQVFDGRKVVDFADFVVFGIEDLAATDVFVGVGEGEIGIAEAKDGGFAGLVHEKLLCCR